MCQDLTLCENNESIDNNIDIRVATTSNRSEIENTEKLKSKFSTTLLKEIKRHIENDLNIKKKRINDSDKFKMIDDLIFHDDSQIYVLEKVRLRVLKRFHDNSIAEHFERNKTLTLLKKWFYWSKTKDLVKKYVKTCDTCMKTKLSKHSFHEKLLSLLASNRVWSNMTIDFVKDFLKFSFYKKADIFDCVMIIVNKLIKITHWYELETIRLCID